MRLFLCQYMPLMPFCLLSFFVLSQVTKLMERVEATFIKHFANGNHSKGMDTLRPKARRERHTITFFLGKTCPSASEDHLLPFFPQNLNGFL